MGYNTNTNSAKGRFALVTVLFEGLIILFLIERFIIVWLVIGGAVMSTFN